MLNKRILILISILLLLVFTLAYTFKEAMLKKSRLDYNREITNDIN